MSHRMVAPEFENASQDLTPRLTYRSLVRESSAVARYALNTGNPKAYALALIASAEASRRVGDVNAAIRDIQSIRALLPVSKYPAVIAWQHWSEANLKRMEGDYSASSHLLSRAVRLALAGKDRTVLKYALAGLAEDQRILGNYDTALLRHKEAFHLFHEDQDARGVVWALEGIAQIERMRGLYRVAGKTFKVAAEIAQEAEDHRGLAYALKGLGECEVLIGNPSGIYLIENACRIFGELDFTIGLSFAEKTKADANCHLGKIVDAMTGYAKARQQFENAGYKRGVAFTLLGEAIALEKVGKHSQAISALGTANFEFKRLKIRAGVVLAEKVRKQLKYADADSSTTKSTVCSGLSCL